MRFWQSHSNLDQPHEDAIKTGLSSRPQLADDKGFDIDHIQFIRHEMKGDRIDHLQVSTWEHDENHSPLTWEVQTGPLDKDIAALYWILL